MVKKFLERLACPVTHSPLNCIVNDYFNEDSQYATDTIKNGYLISAENYLYPIINGIPRMLPDSFIEYQDFLKSMVPGFDEIQAHLLMKHSTIIQLSREKNSRTQKSFSNEWSWFDYNADKTWDADQTGMITRFLKETNETIDSLKDKVLLDAGCGNGLLDKLLADTCKEIYAVDFSISIETAFKNCYHPNICFMQADVEMLPFKPQSFNLIQCSGVLIHLKNPYEGFKHLCRFIEPSGKLSVWMYHPRKDFIHNLFNSIRTYTSKMSTGWQRFIYSKIIYPTSYLIKKAKGNPQNKREMMIDIYDWFSPEFRWEIQHEEAAKWFMENGFENSTITDETVFGFNTIGIKK